MDKPLDHIDIEEIKQLLLNVLSATEDEIKKMFTDPTVPYSVRRLIPALYDKTEGNPRLILEIVKLLYLLDKKAGNELQLNVKIPPELFKNEQE